MPKEISHKSLESQTSHALFPIPYPVHLYTDRLSSEIIPCISTQSCQTPSPIFFILRSTSLGGTIGTVRQVFGAGIVGSD